jgi:hypothetical protein
MSLRKHWKLGAVAVSCAAIGAGASAIATAGASTTATGAAAKSSRAAHAAGRRALVRRAVAGTVVVATGKGYANVSFNRGVVKSVSGRQLTLADGRAGSSYKNVTVTIPSSSKLRDNRAPASLADVKPGQRATVIQAPRRTWVIARTATTP